MSTKVTLDRIDEAMRGHGIEIARDDTRNLGQANINGFNVAFALLSSVVIVRADAATEIPSDDADATFYLAANQVNSASFGARAVIVDKLDNLIVRTERELPLAAGLDDEQLSAALKSAVDAVLATQDAMVAITQNINEAFREEQAD
ncbi:YbjN domain-containing protein [Corynebacterium lubricantis]|uniref:YbjN domain-containing protein n=1 Tax=Corynebacterium lubricantis TaxID=541095 RepID=UPI00037B3764|nr:YbjN domain-containing protein [Corynebacterium lubricantis]